MRTVLRLLCAAIVFCSVYSTASAASDTESPVKGAVQDTITVFSDPYSRPSPEDRSALLITFCDSKVTITTPVQGHNYCISPNRPTRLAGVKTDAVKIEPAIKGEWRFSNDYSLTFTPEESWKAGQAYQVTFGADLFPPHVHITKGEYDFTTAPFYLSSKTTDYLQDPNFPEKKFVTTQLVFNYPVNRESLKKALQFTLEGTQKKSTFSVDFSEHDTIANITTPIQKLEEKTLFMLMQLQQTVTTWDGKTTLQAHAHVDNEFSRRQFIPSFYDYLQISNSSTKVLKNSQYVPQQLLVFESNSVVSAKDMAGALEVKLLPKDKPVPNLSPKKNYAWSSPSEVTPELRQSLEAVAVEAPKESEPSTINALTYSAEGGRYLLVTLKKGMPAPGGYQLGRDYETILQVPALPHEVKVMAQGSLLSLSGEKTLSVLSLGVSSIEYEIGRVKEENLSHLISQTRGRFSTPQFAESYTFNEHNISQIFHDERTVEGADPKKPSYSSFDFSPYLKEGKGLFFLNVKGKFPNTPTEQGNASPHRKNDKAGYGETRDKRFILITDLGLTVKQNAEGTWEAFVQSLAEGGPVRGVAIQVLGTNGEVVAEAQTDRDGHASLPDLAGFKDEKRPVAFVARKGDDLSFLPYARQDRELNYSRFDVNGLTSTEGLRAYLFNDRGIYRPGETAHIGMIVKARDWSKTAAGLPLVLEITNPRGQVVSKQLVSLNAEGIISADYTSSESAATGLYNAALYLGKDEGQKGTELGSVPLRIEEFQPDRMKITSALQQSGKTIEGLAWVKPDQLSAEVVLKHLYGAPAVARKVTGKITLTPSGFGFEAYKDFIFAAEGSVTKSFDETLPETTTDNDGKAHFSLAMSKYGNSTFRLSFMGEGFEPDSGRSVKTTKSVLVSSLDYVVGMKADGNLNYINPNDKRTLSLIAVNASLAKVAAKDMSIELLRSKEVQTLAKDSSGNYEYRSTRIESSVKKEGLEIPAEGLAYSLPTDQMGSYAVVIRNAGGVVLNKQYFTVIGESNAASDFTHEASMQLVLDKKSYAAGEEITLNIQSPYTGTGLITIETDKVHAWKWFTAQTTSSIQKIAIPQGFEGKGFVNVQFTRDLTSKEIFMSPLSFAVAPFAANIDAHDQKIVLETPQDIKPGETVTVQYHSKEAGKIVLYAVDEGILQYAHYNNPDPLDHFLLKRGLEVKTAQIMDLLLPEYSLLKSLSSTGGDGFANDGKNLNPFKRKTEPPVAYWSGILESSPETKNWTFTVPAYFNGSVRVIAVSVSTNAMGAAEAGINVHGPLIVTPNLPLFVAPGDDFMVTATVANYVKGSGADAKIKLDVELSPQLQLLDATVPTLAVPEGKDATAQLHVKATDVLGSGELRLTASAGSEHFTITQTTSVRPPLPSMVTLTSGYSKEAAKTVPQTRVLFPELAETRVAVSSLPVSLIGGLREYLVKYPYGCTEQLTSQNFPNAVLYGNEELIHAFGWKPEEMEKALRVSFDNLRERQCSCGGWGMWNYYSQPHGFVSAYVMHFMLTAKEKNLPVPEEVYSSGLLYLKQQVNQEPNSLEDAREKAYGIYLLTRAGEITTNYIPHLLNYLDSYQKDKWHDDLVAIYLAATYQQMQMMPEANALLDAFHLAAPVRYTTSWHSYAFYDSLTKYSQYVYLIARHFPQRLDSMDKAVIWRVADFVGEGSYSTVSSSYAVMAIDAYITAQKQALAHVTIAAKGLDGKEQALQVLGDRLKTALLKAPASELTFSSGTAGFFYQIMASGFDKRLPEKPLSSGLELKRSYTDEAGKPLASIKLGDVINVSMVLRSGNNESIPNVAIVDLLPGGFELEPEAKPVAPPPAPAAQEQENEEPAAQQPDAGKAPWKAESVDRREDRIVIYGTFLPEERSYHYRMKATSRGSFTVPPAYAESMYDSALKARGMAEKIEVH